MRRILVGIDGTAESRRAALLAANIAQAGGKELVLAHVTPADGASALLAPHDVWRAEMALRRKEMDEVARREARTNAPVQTRLLDGEDAALALAKAALQDEQIEMVVVGHRAARSSLARAIGGSVADRLVQICAKPVLVVR